MGLPVSQTGGDFKPAPAGTHHAVCYAVIQLGTHYNEKFGNEQSQVLVIWELPNERMEYDKDGEQINMPATQSKFYTLSLNEKANLYKDLITWRGRNFTKEELLEFDLFNILTANCQLQIIHDEKGKAKVATVTPLMTGMPKKSPEHKILKYSITEHQGNISPDISDGIKKIILASQEHQAMARGQEVFGDNPDYVGDHPDAPPADDIPF